MRIVTFWLDVDDDLKTMQVNCKLNEHAEEAEK